MQVKRIFMYIMPTLTAVHWFNSKPSFNYQSSDAKNLTFGQKVVSKGNIQKIKQIIFVAFDTKGGGAGAG